MRGTPAEFIVFPIMERICIRCAFAGFLVVTERMEKVVAADQGGVLMPGNTVHGEPLPACRRINSVLAANGIRQVFVIDESRGCRHRTDGHKRTVCVCSERNYRLNIIENTQYIRTRVKPDVRRLRRRPCRRGSCRPRSRSRRRALAFVIRFVVIGRCLRGARSPHARLAER